ncbi:MAG: IS1595 family transposase [Bacteroidales bacterium]|nr:IS1595 family transposase [Bacteroidales bacterium]
MNLIKFIESFPDESSCRVKFKEFRDDQGVICRKCGGTDHYWLQTIEQYQCKKCKTRTTLRSGTVMHASNLPFRYWFIAIHLLTSTKKTFSAKELQRQIGHKFYEPIWLMMQKLRLTMGSRDSRYKLDKIVELDEGFFEIVDTEIEENKKSEPRKRGRGSQKQRKVLVMASTVYDFSKKKKYGKPTKFRYVKMIVVDDLKGHTVGEKVTENIKYDSVIKTDNYTSYSRLKERVWCHIPRKVNPKEAGKVLPWVHTMIANAKRTLLGIHHMISSKYAQNYLDEFCYKVNRRNYGDQLFDRLLIACVTTNYQNIVKHYR